MIRHSWKPQPACRKGIFLYASLYSFFRTVVCQCLLLPVTASNETTASTQTTASLSSATGESLFKSNAKVRYARDFRIAAHDTYKVVSTLNHYGQLCGTLKYILVQRGTKTPTHHSGSQVIETPVMCMKRILSKQVALTDFAETPDVPPGLFYPEILRVPAVLHYKYLPLHQPETITI